MPATIWFAVMEALRGWLPIIAITGPIIAALITLAATRYFREKKRLTFLTVRSEDLTQPLRRSKRNFSFKIDDVEVEGLIRGIVWVTNTGNKEIRDVKCRINVPAERFKTFDIAGSTDALVESISANWRDGVNGPALNVELPFLNPDERFAIRLFFDGPISDCEVESRIEGVKLVFKKSNTISAFSPEATELFLNAYERMLPIIGPILVSILRKRIENRSTQLLERDQ